MADIVLSSRDGAWQPQDCTRGDVLLQYQGNWTATVILADSPDKLPSGRVEVSYFGLSFVGSVARAGTSRDGVCEVLVAGGEGGLWRSLPPLMHDGNPPLRLILAGPRGILAQAGESLSPDSTAAVLDASVAQWPRRAGEAGDLVDDVVREVGAAWRVLPDGSVWVGRDSYEAAYRTTADGRRVELVADADYTTLRTGSRYLQQRVAPLGPFPARPGQSLPQGPAGGAVGGTLPSAAAATSDAAGGGVSGAGGSAGAGSAVAATVGTAVPSPRISTVLHRYDGQRYTVDLWYLDESAPAAGGDDAVVRAIRDIVAEATRYTLDHPAFHGTIVAQRSNGNVDLVMDDPDLPPPTNVRLAAPLPGATLRVAAGSRACVQFLGGDPKLPVAVPTYDQGAGQLTSLRVDLSGALTLAGGVAPTLVVEGEARVTGDAEVGHLRGGGSAPVVVPGTACAAATLVRGHDAGLLVSFTQQAVPVPGTLFAVTFARPYSAAPIITLTPSGAPLAAFPTISVVATTLGFTVLSGAPVTSGALNCVVVG